MKKVRGIYLKNELEIGSMREACRIVAVILKDLAAAVKPGVKTMIFEDLARKRCADFQVKPAFLGMYGFPFALCCSVNEEVVHGFPSDRVLQEGDLVSFDMGVVYDGFYGDSATTVPVGAVNGDRAKLLDVTKESLARGIAQAQAGNDLYDISGAVQKYVEGQGLSVVRRFVGHGIGRKLHEKPEIPNFVPQDAHRLTLLPADGPGHRAHGDFRRTRCGGTVRQLDSGDQGPQLGRAFRAYGGGYEKRPTDFKPGGLIRSMPGWYRPFRAPGDGETS